MRIDVIPFAPAQAQGIVTRNPATAAAESVVVLPPEEISRLVIRPAAVLVIDGAPFSHPMIRLLGLGAPVAIITAAQAAELRADTLLWVDGRRGQVLDRAPAEAEAPISWMPVEQGPLHGADGQLVALRASVATAGASSVSLGVTLAHDAMSSLQGTFNFQGDPLTLCIVDIFTGTSGAGSVSSECGSMIGAENRT
jgi:phosphohistidine swiveling domain-containing protein